MSGWDRGSVFYADVLSDQSRPESDANIESKCTGFLSDFRIDNHFIYR